MRTALVLAALAAGSLSSAQTSATTQRAPAPAIVRAAGPEKWQLQYHYDKDSATLAITDLQFPSSSLGIAAGALVEGRGKPKAVRLITRDGGANWEVQPSKDEIRSMFFVDPRTGWAVSSKKILRTEDGAQTWKPVKSPDRLLRVFFVDSSHGWAIGGKKSIYETMDGGASWKEVAAAAAPQTTAEYTWYNCIGFVTPKVGMIMGYSRPPRPGDDGRFPNWMDPDNPQREVPGMTVMLQTSDGGKTWKNSSTSIFGRITQIRLVPTGTGLGLIEFMGAFRWPSEVFRLDWRSGMSNSVFRAPDRAVTDVALLPDGTAFLGAIEVPGNNTGRAIPGKVRILRTRDFATWEEMTVDYRAKARRVVLATSGNDVWAATDTGMILKLAVR